MALLPQAHVRDSLGWVGHVIGDKYRVEEAVGEGGFALVYRARHAGFDEAVAVKCLKIPALLEEADRAALLAGLTAEGKLLRKLSRESDDIVQALDVGAALSPSGVWTPYLVLDWLEGESLERHLARRRDEGLGGMSPREAAALLRPAALALGVAHAQGVTHRDVKPANLFLTGASGTRTLKVLDFGIAKVLTGSEAVTRALRETGVGFSAFTPQYGAPEQFSRRFGATGPWTDVFALALVFIEVVSGKSALDGIDGAQLFAASSDERFRPSLQAAGVSGFSELDAVLARALAVDPGARYPTASELWAALEAVSTADALPLAATLPAIGVSDPPPPRLTTTTGPGAMTGRSIAPPRRSLAALGALLAIGGVAGVVAFAATRAPAPATPASALPAASSVAAREPDVREVLRREREGVVDCPHPLWVQISTPGPAAPADYRYPMVYELVSKRAELANVRFVEAEHEGKRVFGALAPSREVAERVVEAVSPIGTRPWIRCRRVTPTREVFRVAVDAGG